MSDPRVAVLTLTRDRLDYTKACFRALRENAGLDFDHWVLDQGSTDGSFEWLLRCYKPVYLYPSAENMGIHAGMNMLIKQALTFNEYDLLVKADNDCELLTPGTLKAVAEHVLENPDQPRVVSPLILGLRNRPGIHATRETSQGRLGLTRVIGGIVMPLPPSFVKAGFRYDETAPVWGGDDERISAMANEQGGYTGYLLGYEANHYRTTLVQAEEQKEYFARRVREGGPPL